MSTVLIVISCLVFGLNVASSKSSKASSFEHPLLSKMNQNNEQFLKPITVVYKKDLWQTDGGTPVTQLNGDEFYMLNINEEMTAPIADLVKSLQQKGLKNSVAVTSPSLKTLRLTRKLEPQFIFGAHQNHILQLNMLSSLFLQSLITSKYDFVALKEKKDLSPRARDELQQRGIPIIIL